MNLEFGQILREHSVRYRKMNPQDYGKLAYQSEFGPEHMAPQRDSCLSFLLEEWKTVPTGGEACPAESIGNGLCRFHLQGYGTDAAPLLTDLFLRSAQEHTGTKEGLERRLSHMKALDISGMEKWLEVYRAQGCPPVRHSQAFQDAYQPHYRVLRDEYAYYFPVLLAVRRRMEMEAGTGKPVLVAVDGRCGSGKTELARLLSKVFSGSVFHMDDFYLPLHERMEGWERLVGGNMDLERFRTEVLAPAREGRSVWYRPFDCRTGNFREAGEIPARPLTVVEGSYCLHPLLSQSYDLKIVLTCSKSAQTRRLKAREGAYFPAFQERWIPMEERYLESCRIEESAALVVDTSNFFRL